MKDCIKCGAVSPSDTENCLQCGEVFGASQIGKRPDGSNLKFFAWVIFAVAVGSLATAYWYPAVKDPYGNLDPARIELGANLWLLAGTILPIGTVIWLVGHVVEAISFLPGRDSK